MKESLVTHFVKLVTGSALLVAYFVLLEQKN